MAYLNEIRDRRVGMMDRLNAWMETLGERRKRNVLYRRTLAELSSLTDRDLADLGVHRSEVHRIAHEAAYGS